MVNIKQIRNKLGLTQPELAEILGLSSFVRISEYENGKQSPSIAIKIILLLLDKRIISPEKLKQFAKSAKNT